MAKRRPQVINAAGDSSELTSADLLRIAGGASFGVGFQSEGGIVQPRGITTDFVIQGFLTPVVVSLTGTMSTATWPGGSNVAVAIAAGHRVFKIVGDATLAFTYTASRDTYDDIDYNGTITHVAVTNGAVAPAVTANSLRLQKVVTNATQITAVTQLAPLNGITTLMVARYVSALQLLVLAGSLTLTHGLGSRPRLVWAELECVVANTGYAVGDQISLESVAISGNLNAPALSLWADATNLNIRYNNVGFNILNKATGIPATLTTTSWQFRFFAEL